MSTLTPERLRELLSYNRDTGIFVWRSFRRGKAREGSIAGRVSVNGYRYIKIDGLGYMAHRLAWLYVHGTWPQHQIDHRDLSKDHNWIGNLREATDSQNKGNRKAQNSIKIKGATLHKCGKWQASIAHRYLGLFSTPEEAHAAYMAAALQYYGQFARAS